MSRASAWRERSSVRVVVAVLTVEVRVRVRMVVVIVGRVRMRAVRMLVRWMVVLPRVLLRWIAGAGAVGLRRIVLDVHVLGARWRLVEATGAGDRTGDEEDERERSHVSGARHFFFGGAEAILRFSAASSSSTVVGGGLDDFDPLVFGPEFDF